MHDSLCHHLQQALQEDHESNDQPLEAEALLRDAQSARATDLHLDMQREAMLIRMRIDGRLFDCIRLTPDQAKRLGNQFKAMANIDPIAHFTPEQGRFTYPLDDESIDLRLSLAPCLRGDKISIRIFNPGHVPRQLDQLGFREKGLADIREWLQNVSGMLLVAGPTGSGKTTTLYALLHHLGLQDHNVVTIEDPVEYEVPGINHLQIDHERGLGFVEGMKAMLRMDPDFLMLGEIRDAASADAAITATASGHALMSTLHSRDAVGVVDTLRNYGLSGLDLSSGLMLIVAQRLVRRLCQQCRKRGAPDALDREWLQRQGRHVPDEVWKANGCQLCHGSGYHGQEGIFEVWRIDPEAYQLLLDDADRRTLYRHLADREHRFLIDDGLDKAEEGITTISELRSMGAIGMLHSNKS
jgi:general secretion pathway protein E